MKKLLKEDQKGILPKAKINQANAKLVAPVYVEQDASGVVHEVFCKICGRTILGLVEVGEKRERLVGGVVERTVTVALHKLPLYVVLEIEMEDGSRHWSPACSVCAEEAGGVLEEIYTADLARLAETGMDIEEIAKRKPKTFKLLQEG